MSWKKREEPREGSKVRLKPDTTREHDGGLTSVDLAQLHHELNRIPFAAVGYRYPVEQLREYLGQAAVDGIL